MGKTVVTAGLAAAAFEAGNSVCVYKPIQTGVLEDEAGDCETVRFLTGLPIETVCSYRFDPPATPWVADSHDEISVDLLKATLNALQKQYDVVLVEGAGGVRVPVTATVEMIDLIWLFDAPALVVTRPDLGTINHTLLTVEALMHRKINILGVVVSGFPLANKEVAVETLPRVLEQYLPVPVLRWLPSTKLTQSGLNVALFQELWSALVNQP